MRTVTSFGLAVALGLLTACGGGDSSGPSTGGPSPTPPPPPPPPPTFSYTKFADLTGTQTFQSTCGGEELYFGDTFVFGGTRFGEGIEIVSDRSGPTYQITIPQLVFEPESTVSFFQVDRDPAAPSTAEAYLKTDANGRTQRLAVFAPRVNDVALEYTRQASLFVQRETGFINAICAFGVPTKLNDNPASTRTYGKSYTSALLRKVEMASSSGPTRFFSASASTATATANPATGAIDITLTIRGQEIVGGVRSDTIEELGTYRASTTIDGSEQSFVDTVVNDANTTAGTFGGWFFGPQGRTLAVSFGINDRRPDDSDIRFGGVVYLTE